MEKKRVLVFPSGTEIAFEIVNALKYSKFVEIYGGTSATDHSEFVYGKLIKDFPYVSEPGFLQYLNEVIDKYEIDCVYPAHDDISLFFSEHINDINAQVIITDENTTAICRSKKRTYDYFHNEKFIPRAYSSVDDVDKFPVFVKPAVGQGSAGAKKADTPQELKIYLDKDPSLIICEYLPGMEYTVDCFTDKNGNLLVSKLRDRQRIRAGISVRSRECKVDEDIIDIANIINNSLSFKGAWFFQVKKNDAGEYKLMEISPRIPGTMGLSRNLGINFPMLTLFVFWGYEVGVIDNGYDILVDRAFYSAYRIGYEYEHVYIDFDDTITINGMPNPEVIKYLYQAKNAGKSIHIISKHGGDIYEDLKKCCLSGELFDEIISISYEDEKSKYIRSEKAIFIDDSFAERKKIRERLGIPVFDVDMIECLIDWRV